MGASAWEYFVPFQSDIGAAPATLRRRVFEAADYYREPVDADAPEPTYEDMVELAGDLLDMTAENQAGFLAGLLEDSLEAHRRARLPVTDIDSLLAAQADGGTHSILDITQGVSELPREGAMSPMTGDELIASFGTPRPSHQQVRAWLDDLGRTVSRPRGQGLYVVVYDGDVPSEICFEGYSGD